MAMKGWRWNPYLHMMVPSNSSFDFKPDVKTIDSSTPFTIDLSVVDRLGELECLNNNCDGKMVTV